MKQSGITLAELLISLFVLALVLTLAMGTFVACYRLFYFSRTLDMAHNDVRKSIDQITLTIQQGLCYPVVYNNQGAIVVGGGNGSEIRTIYKGFYSYAVSDVASTSLNLVLENTVSNSSPATVPTAYGTLSNTFSTVSSQPLRNTPAFYGIFTGDVIRIDDITLAGGYISSWSSNASTISAQIASPIGVDVQSGTRVVIGREARFVATNWYTNYTTGQGLSLTNMAVNGFTVSGELRYYPDASNPNQYKVLVSNLNITNPFIVNSALCTIDIRYVSPGDITGKGIYRIQTQATVRNDPSFQNRSKTPVGGINGVPSGGVYD